MKIRIAILLVASMLAGCSSPRIQDATPYTVNVSGEVEQQGCYAASAGMNLRDVLRTAGLTDVAKYVRVERKGKVVFRADLQHSLDFPVQNDDEVIVEKRQ